MEFAKRVGWMNQHKACPIEVNATQSIPDPDDLEKRDLDLMIERSRSKRSTVGFRRLTVRK
jgi:hypothetical protein